MTDTKPPAQVSGADTGSGANPNKSASNEYRKRKTRSNKYESSMTIALLGYWVLPVLLFAIASRFVVYTGPAIQPLGGSKPVTLNMDKMQSSASSSSSVPSQKPSSPPTLMPEKERRRNTDRMPSLLADKPTSYQQVRSRKESRKKSALEGRFLTIFFPIQLLY